jgi:hypothetical protein
MPLSRCGGSPTTPKGAAPVLTAAWHGNPQTRMKIAEAATGPLADALQPLFGAEIAANRRFNVSANSWSSVQVEQGQLRGHVRSQRVPPSES